MLAYRSMQRFVKDADSQQFLVECVVGAHTVKANAIEPLAQSQWVDKRIAFAEEAFHSYTLSSLALVSIQYIGTVMTAVILFFGARAVMAGELSIGALVAFNMIATRSRNLSFDSRKSGRNTSRCGSRKRVWRTS